MSETTNERMKALAILRENAANEAWNAEATSNYESALEMYESEQRLYASSLEDKRNYDIAFDTFINNAYADQDNLKEILSGMRRSAYITADQQLSLQDAVAAGPYESLSEEQRYVMALAFGKLAPEVIVPKAKMPKTPKLRPVLSEEEKSRLVPEKVVPCDLPGLIHPEVDVSFHIKQQVRSLLGVVDDASRFGSAPNILLTGPAGCGKTELAMQYAAMAGLPMLKVTCSIVREPRDWFGSKTLENGQVSWRKSLFAQAVEKGGVVILLDELNRATPNVLNPLLPLLDRTRASFIEEVGEVLHVGPGVVFIATLNQGLEFTGTTRLDKALADRFGVTIEAGYLDEEAECALIVQRTGLDHVSAHKLAKVASTLRANAASGGGISGGVSTRLILDTAALWTTLGVDALRFTLLPAFPQDGGATSPRAAVMTVLQSQFGAELATV